MPIQILMPALSPTMTEGTLAKWLKGEGDAVVAGDILAEIETDKATMEVEAVDEGVLAKIVIAEGSEGVPVNAVIAVLLEEGEDTSALEGMETAPEIAAPPPAPAPEATPALTPAAAPNQPASAPQTAPPAALAGDRIFASPLARRMAEQAGLDLAAVAGSGPNGRIVKRDIEAALSGGLPATAPAVVPTPAPATAPAPQSGALYTEVANNTMRKVIAQRLTEAKRDIPHFYLTVDCEVDALLALRKDLNGRTPEGAGAYRLSVNDFVVRAVALALRQVPAANATWTDAAVLLYSAVDVAVAVATPGGLITPVVRNVDNKGLSAISNEVKDLAERARDGKLAPEEYQGGGFTISNLGMYGVKDFSAIINPPQSCILAVGAGEQRPVVHDGALAIATVMTCTLSVDHRSVDGAVGAEFLAAYKRLIEEPLTMLL
jgi:pyruvate dehydrogenase E2 component (dihydrolipoamide acetyltransferase)